MRKFAIGDKVRFREDYEGYFVDFKGKELTVAAVFPKDSSTDGPSVTLKEILGTERHHLVGVNNLELI